MVSSVKTAVILCSQSSCFLFRGVSGSFWPHSKDYLMLDLELIIGSNVLHVLLRLFIIFFQGKLRAFEHKKWRLHRAVEEFLRNRWPMEENASRVKLHGTVCC